MYLYHHHLLSEGFESATAISTLKQHAGSYDEVLLAVLQSHCVNDDNRVDLEKEQRNASLFKALKLCLLAVQKDEGDETLKNEMKSSAAYIAQLTCRN